MVLMVWLFFLHYTSLCISCDKNLEEFLMLCFVLWTSCCSFLSIKIYVCTWVDILFVNNHIDKCNKNYKKVDILTSILACLSSSVPTTLVAHLTFHVSKLKPIHEDERKKDQKQAYHQRFDLIEHKFVKEVGCILVTM